MRRRRWRGRAATGYLLEAARRRLARSGVECAAPVHAVVHAPAEVLVEGRGLPEHPGQARHAVDRPTTDVLIKGRGVAEHVAHPCDARGVPRADVVVEGRRARFG